ncbi:MAG: hypothetical protein ACRC2U_15820 [Aeromonas sp.]
MNEPTSSSLWGHQGQACGEGVGPGLPPLLRCSHIYIRLPWHKAASAEQPIVTVTVTPLPTVAESTG